MMDQIEITVGTYENLILGYRVEKKAGDGFTLESSFTNDSHRGALRCMSVSPQGVLASSSTDDSIRLHSLKKRKEVGSLFQHDGSVNCIRFFKGGHMFSASEDGTICLWKCKSWELLRVLKGHKSHVMAVAVHPSAKLGLSVGSDRAFFTWDMTTGKLAFKRKIEQVAQDILFTEDGNHYLLVYHKKIEVCSLEDTMVIQEIDYESRINSVCFVKENIVVVGEDSGKVSVVDVILNSQLMQETYKGRVRTLCTLSTKEEDLLFVATSTGYIRVCRLDFTEGSEKLETALVFDSGVRITCMTAYGPPEILKEVERPVKDKRKRKRKAYDMTEDSEMVVKEDSDVNDEEDETGNLEAEIDDLNENEEESDDDLIDDNDKEDSAHSEEISEDDKEDSDSDSEEAKKEELERQKNESKRSTSQKSAKKTQKVSKSEKKQKKLKSERAIHPRKKKKLGST